MAAATKREMLILQRRKSLKSQIEIATELGISQAKYSYIENGYCDPSDNVGRMLCEMFGLPDNYFDDTHAEAKG